MNENIQTNEAHESPYIAIHDVVVYTEDWTKDDETELQAYIRQMNDRTVSPTRAAFMINYHLFGRRLPRIPLVLESVLDRNKALFAYAIRKLKCFGDADILVFSTGGNNKSDRASVEDSIMSCIEYLDSLLKENMRPEIRAEIATAQASMISQYQHVVNG